LVSDRLETSQDPEVQRITPRIISSIERAVSLCAETLSYVGKEQQDLKIEPFALRALISAVSSDLTPDGELGLNIENEIEPTVEVTADREQLYRVVNNIARNAAEAGAGKLVVSAHMNGKGFEIDLRVSGWPLPAS
jgi:signal transduction histidine kinase